MQVLTAEHIDYIIKDLGYRGILHDQLRDELVDHICSCVEADMHTGTRFIDAYHSALKKFGHTTGLQTTQQQVLITENKTTRLMLRNYLTIAFRSLSKNAFYTTINVAGLALGIAAFLTITLYVLHEFSYDKHFAHAERIYRVDNEILFNENHHVLAVAPAPLAETALHDFPEVEAATRFRSWGSYLIKRTTENIKEDRIIFADNQVFKVFSLNVIMGDQKNALTEPNSLAISRSAAEKYFPGESPIGQTLILDNKENFKVTAVFEDFPINTHFRYDFFMSMISLEDSKVPNWLSNNYSTYILLKSGADPKELEAKFPKMVDTYVGPQVQTVFGSDFTMKKFFDSGNKFEFSLMPLLKIHLYSDKTSELGVNSDITYIYLFAAIAFFILAIACINFMNLSTARSANRAKEVGVRKVLGSLRSHLIKQFLTESVLLSMGAFIIGILLAAAFLPMFNELAQKSIRIPFNNPAFIGSLIALMLMIGFLAGIYPSLFLSAFKPVHVLKGKLAIGMKSGVIRSSLVIFQFIITIFLVIGTLTIQRQLSFIQNKKLGFKKDQVIVLHDAYALGKQLQPFKNEVLKNHTITHASVSGYLPIAGWGRSDNTFWPEGTQPSQGNLISMQSWAVDHDYIPTFGMNVVEGRNFSRDFPSDSSAVILNQSAIKRFGFKEPIGQKIVTYSSNDPRAVENNNLVTYIVVGIMEDFHFESLKENISPLAIFLERSNSSISFRFESTDTRDVINTLEKTWKAMAPGQPFQYTFLDDAFGNTYRAEQKLGQIFGLFAGLAIIIACLGLFALSAFTAEQRTKEIGIRKVLGASVSSIVMLLSKEFGKLVIIAFAIAAPASWFAVNWWLESYTYKVEIGVFIYLMAGVAAFLLAWLTIGYQSFKAAMSNPVKSLRSE